jgi:hypothetical protein
MRMRSRMFVRPSKIFAERIFKALFKSTSPKSSTHVCEKCFENPFPNTCSTFQNLRLGTIDFASCLQKNTNCGFFDIPTSSFGGIVASQKSQRIVSHVATIFCIILHSFMLFRFRTVGRCTIFAFVTLGQKNHKMHISHTPTDSRTVGRRKISTPRPC